jgi:type VI secretion system protein ImpH
MPSDAWDAGHPFVRLARKRGREFEYFQLLHLLERIEPNAARIGHVGPVRDEIVRLRPALSLGFPCGDIDNIDWIENAAAIGRMRVTTTFLGLYGSDSPLPSHLTESMLINKDKSEEYEKDERVREYLDQFHHRVLSLLFRVWLKYRYEATFRGDGQDPISLVVRGVLGLGTPHVEKSLTVPAIRMFRYAGIMSQKPRSAAGLVGQLSDYFPDVAFDVEPCVGRWVPIEEGDRNRSGQRKCSLGRDFLLGRRKFDRSGKFRVGVGPVGFDDYTRFLPDGSAAVDLAQVVRLYCDDPLEFDVKVTLRGDEVPQTPMYAKGVLGRLARTSWLKSRPSEDKSVVFRP